MGLTYRLHQPEDEPALRTLWSEHSGWGEIDAEFWNHWMHESPAGEATIVVAEDSGSHELVGQIAFVPAFLHAHGREHLVARALAPILATGRRTTMNLFRHPILRMYQHGIQALRARNVDLVYAVPNPRFGDILRRLPFFQTAAFPMWSCSLPLKQPWQLDRSVSVRVEAAGYAAADELWRNARDQFDCQLVRDARQLAWKWADFYRVVSVRREGELVGLVALKEKGERQTMICDLLVNQENGGLRTCIAAACNVASTRAVSADPPIDRIGILAHSSFCDSLSELGFSPSDHTFLVAVQLLESSLHAREFDARQWFVGVAD